MKFLTHISSSAPLSGNREHGDLYRHQGTGSPAACLSLLKVIPHRQEFSGSEEAEEASGKGALPSQTSWQNNWFADIRFSRD